MHVKIQHKVAAKTESEAASPLLGIELKSTTLQPPHVRQAIYHRVDPQLDTPQGPSWLNEKNRGTVLCDTIPGET